MTPAPDFKKEEKISYNFFLPFLPIAPKYSLAQNCSEKITFFGLHAFCFTVHCFPFFSMHAAIKTQGQGRGGGVICGENFFTHSPFTFSGKYTYKKREKLNFRNGFYSTASHFPSFSRRLNFIAGKWLRPQRAGVLEKEREKSLRGRKKTLHFPDFFIFLPCFLLYYSGRNVNLPCPQFFPFLLLLRSHNFRMERKREGKNRG